MFNVSLIINADLFLKATLEDYRLVFDAVYTPRRTRLLNEADAAGAITVAGVEMFLRQAIGQFNLFTGLEGTIFTFCFHLSPLYHQTFLLILQVYHFLINSVCIKLLI